MLGLSIDILDELDDEVLATLSGIRFIAEEGFAGRYGNAFAITLQGGKPILSASAITGLGK